MARQGDILMVEGGALHAPFAMQELRYLPPIPRIEELMETEEVRALREQRNRQIWGCLLSGLITRRWKLESTVAKVGYMACRQHDEALRAHGFQAPPLHLEAEMLPASLVQMFRAHYGVQ